MDDTVTLVLAIGMVVFIALVALGKTIAYLL
jgi:hypothetical protein